MLIEDSGMNDRHALPIATAPPSTLYKYRVWGSPYHPMILKERQLFFASPKDFNDPFDGKIRIRRDKQTKKQWREGYKDYFTRHDTHLNRAEKRERMKHGARTRRRNKHEFAELDHAQTLEAINRGYGICSLSPINSSILMWSHYADSHKGFCVGFETQRLLDFFAALEQAGKVAVNLFEVEYCEKYPIFIPPERARSDTLLKVMLKKASAWAYEKEFRLIAVGPTEEGFSDEERILSVPPNAIKEVILGCRISQEDQDEILRVVDGSDMNPEIFVAEEKRDSFELQLTAINSD